MTALKNETIWLHDLMQILGIHIIDLKNFDNFIKEYNELSIYQAESAEQFQILTSSISASFDQSMKEDIINQFNIFKLKFQNELQFKQQIEHLYLFVDQLPNFKMRKINLKPPYDKSRILVKYSQADVSIFIFKREFCDISAIMIVSTLNQANFKAELRLKTVMVQ